MSIQEQEQDPPSRSDLKLWETALRQDWPIPPDVKKRILQTAVNLIDSAGESTGDEDEDEDGSPDPRVIIGAMRVLAAFGKLTIDQQKLDLMRVREERRALLELGPQAGENVGGIDPEAALRALRALNGLDTPGSPAADP